MAYLYFALTIAITVFPLIILGITDWRTQRDDTELDVQLSARRLRRFIRKHRLEDEL